jgi:uroporphyrinogen-III synthase
LQFWVAQRLRPVWLLTSGEGIRAINAALQNMGLAQWWACSHFVVTHPSLVAQLPVPPEVIEHASIVKICLPTEDAIFNAFVAA